jgi:cell division FtsZ-interacting protein ZapD
MTGTPSQIEWAELIQPRVNAEFDRVAKALRSAAANQVQQEQVNTVAIIGILEEKRVEVMANERAGYFIREWQEITDQVRRMISQDPRHRAIQANRAVEREKLTA